MQRLQEIDALLERVLQGDEDGATQEDPASLPQPGDPWTPDRARTGFWRHGDEEALLASIPQGPELVYAGDRTEIIKVEWLQGLWARIFYTMGTFSVEAIPSEVRLARTTEMPQYSRIKYYEMTIQLTAALFTATLTLEYENRIALNGGLDNQDDTALSFSITNLQVLNPKVRGVHVQDIGPARHPIRESRGMSKEMGEIIYIILNHLKAPIKANLSYDSWCRMTAFRVSINPTDRAELVADQIEQFIAFDDKAAAARVERQLVLLSIETGGTDTHTITDEEKEEKRRRNNRRKENRRRRAQGQD